jgi:hypothetical protein
MTSVRARDDLFGQERLGHVVVGALSQATHARRRTAERAEHQHGQIGQLGQPAEPLDDLVAAHAGQHQVEHDQVDVGGDRERLEGRLAGGHHGDVVALRLEQVAQQDRGVGVVLDDEDACSVDRHRAPTPCVSSVAATTRAISSGVKGLAT